MTKKTALTSLASAIGATFVVSLANSPVVSATENPFAANELSRGFMVAEEAGKCGTICGGATPTVKDGEMVKCASTCGEVAKCGNICGGQAALAKPSATAAEGKDAEVAKCGTICAALK